MRVVKARGHAGAKLRVTGISLVSAVAALAMTASPQARAETRVVATIKPIHALVSRVMEGTGQPALLVTGSASPHTYALKPSDAKALNSAKIFFRVSEQVEPFTGKIVKSLPKGVTVVTLAEAPGVELLDKRTGDTFEAHEHGGHDDHDHGHGHKSKKGGHAKNDDHDGHDEGVRDGHVWLDPRNAKAMTSKIAEALAQAEPDKADVFKANAERLKSEIDALEADIGRELEVVKGKPFVVFHDAYQYFERRFGLTAVGSVTVSPEVQPSAKRLKEIRSKISGLSASCVFAEPQFSAKLVNAVTEGTPSRSGVLDPEGATIKEGPQAYFELMRGLASGLKTCLVQGS